jgi:hypothetical protein
MCPVCRAPATRDETTTAAGGNHCAARVLSRPTANTATWPPMARAMLHAAAARLITGVADWLSARLQIYCSLSLVSAFIHRHN